MMSMVSISLEFYKGAHQCTLTRNSVLLGSDVVCRPHGHILCNMSFAPGTREREMTLPHCNTASINALCFKLFGRSQRS